MNNQESFMFWVDIETTGLDPVSDEILELGAIITDFELNTLGSYHIVYAMHNPELYCNSFVEKMHTDNGLLKEVHAQYIKVPGLTACSEETRDDLCAFIKTHCGDVRPVPAGSSVHFDMGFIENVMPDVNELLHYRRFDCRTLQTAVKAWAPIDVNFPKAGAHRAMADIEETLAYARIVKSLMRTLRNPSTFEGFR